MNLRLSLKLTACCVVLAAGAVLPATAEEVVVKNDSVDNNTQAFIVGDFIPGEHAGVVLEAPCAGHIVAVQILWISQFGDAVPTVENAIHIYQFNQGAFPVPGVELEAIEGPVMQPGFLNEFRFIDEQGTIPLHVPVVGAQKFYVTLEFGEATDILGGTASVLRDLNGCQAQKNVLFAIPGGWQNFCSYIGGDLVIRVVIDCTEPGGASCFPNGTCQNDVQVEDCISTFGAVWTQDHTCAQVSCTPRGACCRLGSCLTLVSPGLCQSIGGVYAGDGSDCGEGVCASGACCAADGTCTTKIQYQCGLQAGTWLGAGTTCSPNLCPQPSGACCFDVFCIANQFQSNCVNGGGIWEGPNSTCTPNPCQAPAGCAGDMDCNGQVNFFDIDPFVLALSGESTYLAQYPDCRWLNGDCAGDNDVDFFDIDPFVERLGSSCP